MDVLSSRRIDLGHGRTAIVTHVIDPHGGFDEDDADPNLMPDERTQVRARRAAFERGEWYYVGVCVTIRQQTSSNWADGGLEIGRSSIWGIESDSDPAYFAEVERRAAGRGRGRSRTSEAGVEPVTTLFAN